MRINILIILLVIGMLGLMGTVSAAAPPVPAALPARNIPGSTMDINALTGWVWHDMHGTAATVQDMGNLVSYYKFGWGPDFYIKPDKWTWVHIPISALNGGISNPTARYIYVLYYGASVNATVTQIDVYNGPTKVKTFTAPSLQAWAGPGYRALSLDLGPGTAGKGIPFPYGMSLSLLMRNTRPASSTTNERMIFFDGGAYWYIQPTVVAV